MGYSSGTWKLKKLQNKKNLSKVIDILWNTDNFLSNDITSCHTKEMVSSQGNMFFSKDMIFSQRKLYPVKGYTLLLKEIIS